MKKALIGMAVGAIALGATVVPASAGELGYSLWDGIDGDWSGCDNEGFDDSISDFAQLVLIGGWANKLDTTGNGKPSYTVFAPDNTVIEAVLDALKVNMADLNDQPDLVKSLLADHIANGSFDSDELANTNLTRITMRSGYVATVFGESDPISRTVGTDVYISGAFIYTWDQYDNGWLYGICGLIDSTPQVPTEGLNSQDAPKDGTPGGTNSLPNTL